MNAVMIIDEIMHLAPEEQARVVQFVQAWDRHRAWTGQELSSAAAQMLLEKDPAEADAAWERIVTGFYGEARSA